jgi:hypothetical protein
MISNDGRGLNSFGTAVAIIVALKLASNDETLWEVGNAMRIL